MLTLLGLFYALKLRNRIYCMFIFTFFVQMFLKRFFFAHCPIEYEQFANRPICFIDGTLTLLIKVDQGVMVMKEYSTLPKFPKLEPPHQM